jgi:hypothetical protein
MIPMTKIEQAVAYFKEGFSCSQAIVAAYAPSLGLDRDTALKIASGFGGGMGRLAETCGAVTGSFMVLAQVTEFVVQIFHGVRTYVHFLVICSTTSA